MHTQTFEASTAPTAPTAASPPAWLASIDQLLRDPAALFARIRRGERLPELARTLVLTVLLGAGAFGAAVGAYRGGVQILFAAIKLPVVILLCAALAAPALTCFNAALGRRASLAGDLAVLLAALAQGGLTLAALAPILLLATTARTSYHDTVLLLVGCCAVAGLVSLILLARGLAASEPARRAPVVLGLVGVLLMVGSQMAWTFRPYVVRPRTPEPPFLRSLEGSLYESVGQSWESSQGHFRDSYQESRE